MAVVLESRDLFSRYLAIYPNLYKRLNYDQTQEEELAASLARINDQPTNIADNVMTIEPQDEKVGGQIAIAYYPKLMVHKLTVARQVIPEGEDPELMRLLMISKGALSAGNYPVMAEATHAGERLPLLGLRPGESKVNQLLRAWRLAAVYDITPVPVARDRHVIKVDIPGQPKSSQTWQELSKRFDHATALYMVMGRVFNVGRVNRAA